MQSSSQKSKVDAAPYIILISSEHCSSVARPSNILMDKERCIAVFLPDRKFICKIDSRECEILVRPLGRKLTVKVDFHCR
jgi:hypothetical protein